MRIAGLNRRRSGTLLLALGQLVLIAYVFQIAAFDHWNIDPGHDVRGVVNSSAHEAHCHGDASGCADSAGSVTIAPDTLLRLPSPPAARAEATSLQQPALIEAGILTPPEPPRTA